MSSEQPPKKITDKLKINLRIIGAGQEPFATMRVPGPDGKMVEVPVYRAAYDEQKQVPAESIIAATDNIMSRLPVYEEAFRVISKLRADGVISAPVYEVLWSGLDRERAADSQFNADMKKYLPKNPKSAS